MHIEYFLTKLWISKRDSNWAYYLMKGRFSNKILGLWQWTLFYFASSPSEMRFALFRTFDRGRFSLLPFYPGWRGPRHNWDLTRLWFGTAYPGLLICNPFRELTVEGFWNVFEIEDWAPSAVRHGPFCNGGIHSGGIAPQSFKSCMKNPNNITALSRSRPVIARSSAQSKFER